jgi:hypothetical protein
LRLNIIYNCIFGSASLVACIFQQVAVNISTQWVALRRSAGSRLVRLFLAGVLGANHIRTECGCLPQHMYPSRTWTVRGRTSDHGSHHHSRAHGTIVNRRMYASCSSIVTPYSSINSHPSAWVQAQWEETMPANQTWHSNSEKQTRPTGSWRLSVE